MKRTTFYQGMVMGTLAFAAATFWLQAQPEGMTDEKYLEYWNNIPKTERDDIIAMINKAPKGTTNTFDYYKNLIDRSAANIPSAIGQTAKAIDFMANITKDSLYRLLKRIRDTIQAPGEEEDDLTVKRAITNAVDAVKKNSEQRDDQLSLLELLRLAEERTTDTFLTLNLAMDQVFQNIGADNNTKDGFDSKKTVYGKLDLARTKINAKTGQSPKTIAGALLALEDTPLSSCEQHKTLVDARSTTKTLQAAINAVNGQPKHATNKTYGLLGNLKKYPTKGATTPLNKYDIYGRLSTGISHLNAILKLNIQDWGADKTDLAGIIKQVIAKTPTTLSPNDPADTGEGDDEGGGG